MNTEPTIQELSATMEKMYYEHNAQMKVLSKMITTLARISINDPQKFFEEVSNDENLIFANKYNEILDESIKDELLNNN